ncbi:conserved protein of unknown function [Tenacibaculum sp. 190130A14a]|uniref:Carboxypeptidase-like protein n=1 Tax=Tenacibaculum polynesiense TaxID=3137857 RepID=A0ABP1F4H8_9FLAO
MKTRLFFLFIFLGSIIYAQEERKTLFGIVYDKNGVLENAHIVNFSNNTATFTDENGEYRIFARPTDTLRFTSIGYKTIFVELTKKHFNTYRKRVTLEKQDYELEEILVRNNELSGDISKDVKKVKHDTRQKEIQEKLNIKSIDYTNNYDYNDSRLRHKIVKTDPTRDFEGVGTTTFIPLKNTSAMKALRKELEFKENMPAKLLSELGEEFFFTELKIPVERYYHFLEYCNPLNIENFYQNREVLKVINIFRNEHVNYLKIIEKE